MIVGLALLFGAAGGAYAGEGSPDLAIPGQSSNVR
jgi:hypothetical protein